MPYTRDVNFFSPTKKAVVTDAESIRQQLAILFNTRPPQRLFDPEFGINLEQFLFDLITPENANLIFFEIVEKVKRYCPLVSIDMQKSQVIPDEDNLRYILDLKFTINGAEADGTYQMTRAFLQP